MIALPLVLLLAQTAAPAASPAPAAASARPVVALETSLGTIKIALDRDKAPVTVENFLQYVRSGHYDGTIFHRVIPNFMVQGGGFDADMKQKPTKAPIKNAAVIRVLCIGIVNLLLGWTGATDMPTLTAVIRRL